MSHPFNKLHPRQQAIIRHIQTFSAQHGYPPTMRQLCQALDFPSTCIPAYHVDRLVAFGWLERDRHAARTLRVIRQPPNKVQRVDRRGDRPAAVSIHLDVTDGQPGALQAATAALQTLETFIARFNTEA